MLRAVTVCALALLAACDAPPVRREAPASAACLEDTARMILLSAGRFSYLDEEKGGEITAELRAFALDADPVTVAQFRRFVAATGHRTAAARFGNSAVFDQQTGTWSLVEGASFEYPLGPAGPRLPDDHPATHVAWEDAAAYCACAGKRLPTGAEWVYAAQQAGKSKTRYAWGDRLVENGLHRANTWQGVFPYRHDVEDGFVHTSPVGFFGRTALGFADLGGNVWNWVQDDRAPAPAERQAPGTRYKEMRGGSFLCDPKWCHGFRTEGVSSSSPETSLMHVGFRCAR